MPLPQQKPNLNQDLGVVGFRPSSISAKTPVTAPRVSTGRASSPASADEPAARSRSRSAARSSENLLVSLDSCPPIANDSVTGEVLAVERRNFSMRVNHRPSLLGGTKLNTSRSCAKDEEILSATTAPGARLPSVARGQNAKIKIRYSTKQLLSIFKSLGRF